MREQGTVPTTTQPEANPLGGGIKKTYWLVSRSRGAAFLSVRAIASGKVLGRRPVENDADGARKAKRARKLLAAGVGINKVAKTVGLSNGTVARLRGRDCVVKNAVM